MMKWLNGAGFLLLTAFAFIIFYSFLVFETRLNQVNLLPYAAASMFLLFRFNALLKQGFKLAGSEVLLLALLSICWGTILYHKFNSVEEFSEDGFPAIQQVFNHLVFGCLWLLVGASVARFKAKPSNLIAVLLMSALAAAVVLGVLNSEGSFTIEYWKLDIIAEDNDRLTHLTFGYLATLIYAMSYSFATSLRPIIFVVGFLVLFPLDSRSAFFITVTAIIIFELLAGSRKIFARLIVPVALIGVAIFTIVQLDVIDFDDPRNRRMLLAEGVDDDLSAQARSDILQESLAALPSQFFIGDPAYVVRQTGDHGLFIHNLLSAWQFFGFPAFVMFIVCLLAALRRARRTVRQKQLDPVQMMGFIILIYIIIGVVVTHFVAHKLLWFSLGFWLLREPDSLQLARSRAREQMSDAHTGRKKSLFDLFKPKRKKKRRRRSRRNS